MVFLPSSHTSTQPNPQALRCEPCDRQFKDTVALEQHRHAKHSGKYQGLKPDWSTAAKAAAAAVDNKEGRAAAVATPPAPSLHFKGVEKAAFEAAGPRSPQSEAVLCPVCDYYVPESGAAHLADLRPPERPTFVCEGCERTFREERALKQHANFCWAMKGKEDAT